MRIRRQQVTPSARMDVLVGQGSMIVTVLSVKCEQARLIMKFILWWVLDINAENITMYYQTRKRETAVLVCT